MKFSFVTKQAHLRFVLTISWIDYINSRCTYVWYYGADTITTGRIQPRSQGFPL